MKPFGLSRCGPLRLVVFSCMANVVVADEIGSVDTKFNLLSPDDSIKVAAVKDPKVSGVACYLSRAQKGGYSGALGLAGRPDNCKSKNQARRIGISRTTLAYLQVSEDRALLRC